MSPFQTEANTKQHEIEAICHLQGSKPALGNALQMSLGYALNLHLGWRPRRSSQLFKNNKLSGTQDSCYCETLRTDARGRPNRAPGRWRNISKLRRSIHLGIPP